MVLPFGTGGFGRYVSVRLAPENFGETIQYIEDIWHKFAGNQAFEFVFFDQEFARLYASEERTAKIMSIFAALAIIIACLGLFGLASFSTEQRTKEIGVRKVLGASVANVIFMLSKDIIKLVILANIIALPLVIYVMNNWLENFAYRIDLGYVVFISSAFIAFLIANPSTSLLKYI